MISLLFLRSPLFLTSGSFWTTSTDFRQVHHLSALFGGSRNSESQFLSQNSLYVSGQVQHNDMGRGKSKIPDLSPGKVMSIGGISCGPSYLIFVIKVVFRIRIKPKLKNPENSKCFIQQQVVQVQMLTPQTPTSTAFEKMHSNFHFQNNCVRHHLNAWNSSQTHQCFIHLLLQHTFTCVSRNAK